MFDEMKRFLQKAAGLILQPALRRMERPLSRQNQILLSLKYREFAEIHKKPLEFESIYFDEYSETGEDGILLYIFSLIGATNRKFADIGCGGINGNNTTNLTLNHGFSGLMVDGDKNSILSARRFFEYQNASSRLTLKSAFVSAENINAMLSQHGLQGSIDLLSIDIDGIDYWLWKAIDVIDPRVVLVEYQDLLGPDLAWTIPYKPDFDASSYPANKENKNYCGASLRAFTKLANSRGYRLVGCNRGGWNAFFVKNGLADDVLPEVSVESCFKSDWNRYGMEHRFPLVKDMEWVEV
ncbi:MAG TPA: hypothetical protein PK414_12730 [Anaerolineales bacterium]|nr:hypothetical protein [Anaerolineales bacterium]